MFDVERLFTILYQLAHEKNDFLLAQDALAILRGCIQQLEELNHTIADLCSQLEALNLSDDQSDSIELHQLCIRKLENTLAKRPTLVGILAPLRTEAEDFWFCSPVDHSSLVRGADDRIPIEQWRRFRGEGELTPEIKSKIENFRSHCREVIERHFSELLVELKQEEALEEAESAKLCIRDYRLLNKVPLSLMPYLEDADRSFLNSSAFPVTHYRTVDKQFASLLGFSIARLLTFPMLSFGVNTKETNEVLQQLAGNSSKQETSNAILFYRTVTRDVVCVHWEIAANAVSGMHYGRGVDVTSEVEASRLKQAVGIQKMLRQWLHSIRNASFEQQATVIMEEVRALEGKIEGSQYSAEFQSIYDCVKLLMHTAKTSVGLIDQALDSKGFTQHMCAGDFVSSLVSFPHHFAQSEGLPAIYTKFRFVLDGRVAQPADFLTLFVTGDVVSIQSVVDNILSNAVRYTDPVKGLEVSLSVDRHDGKLNFALKISDFTHGGLPPAALVFLQEGLGVAKCSRSGGYDLQTERDRPVSKGRSSRTGLPHIVESYHHLTESGTDDFDITVQTSMTGTTFRVRFAMDLMAPVSVTAAAEPLGNIIQGTIVVADDSMVIRKILTRYLEASQCSFHMCSDGEEAWHWVQRHSSICAAVITDLEMPKMGGDTLVTNMNDAYPDVPCFILSGNDISLETLPRGARRAVVKPVTSEQIQNILEEISTVQALSSDR